MADKPHVRDKIAEMIKLASAIYALGIAAAIKSTIINGVAFPDAVMTNAGKHLTMEAHYTCARLLNEVAGGAAVTIPSVRDLKNPEVAPYIEKYFKAAPGVSVADRIRLFHFIGDLCSRSMQDGGTTRLFMARVLRQRNECRCIANSILNRPSTS